MFDRKEFIRVFSALGDELGRLCRSGASDNPSFAAAMEKAREENPFFTPFMQFNALKAIADNYLTAESLEKLLSYSKQMLDKTVGIIMAGNIPAVGFHDLLSTLSTGAGARVKLSSKDSFLIPAIVKVLESISPEFSSRIVFDSSRPIFAGAKLDFLLFSGSDEVKVLLCDEFPGVPMLARGTRFSLAVLSGNESEEELESLSRDMFLYCGLGCRSASYLFLPEGFDVMRIIRASQSMEPHISEIAPFKNSYKRLRAMALMEERVSSSDEIPDGCFADGGFFLLERSDSPFPPLGVVRFNYYRSLKEADAFCTEYRDRIQKKYTNFGIAQAPATDDWMDGINTVQAITEGCLKG